MGYSHINYHTEETDVGELVQERDRLKAVVRERFEERGVASQRVAETRDAEPRRQFMRAECAYREARRELERVERDLARYQDAPPAADEDEEEYDDDWNSQEEAE